MIDARRRQFTVAALFAVLVAACSSTSSQPDPPAVTTLTCQDSASGGLVGCTLDLQDSTGFHVTLVSHDCYAKGNTIRLTLPIDSILTADGCHEVVGQVWDFPGPFTPGTKVGMEVVSSVGGDPPSLLITGAYPTWTATFEDGYDADFNDLIMTISAGPAGP